MTRSPVNMGTASSKEAMRAPPCLRLNHAQRSASPVRRSGQFRAISNLLHSEASLVPTRFAEINTSTRCSKLSSSAYHTFRRPVGGRTVAKLTKVRRMSSVSCDKSWRLRHRPLTVSGLNLSSIELAQITLVLGPSQRDGCRGDLLQIC
jgi:hypothetical protein